MTADNAEEVTNLGRRALLKLAGAAGLSSLGVNQAAAETVSQEQDTDSEMSFDPIEATVSDIITAIGTGRETAVSITEQYLARIEEYDEMEAIITVNDNAIERAEALDEQLAESGPAGPLHGVPLILKDNNDTADMPTTAGSLSLEESVPPDDAFLVTQLRDAGGIVLAKANLHEFARGIEGFSSLGGQTRNPYDLGRNPGGSSSGTGAAIGANLGVVGTGTDTCGSVRIPSAFQSLVGVRPTMGLLSRDGIVPLKLTQDTLGPMTRTVRDAAITLDVLVGYDPADPITARGAQEAPPLTESSADSYTDFLDYDGLEGVRIGVLRNLFGAGEDAEEDAAADAAKVTSVVDSAIEEMSLYGAEIVDPVEIPNREELLGAAGTDWDREFKRDLNNYLDSLEDPQFETVEELEASGLFACRDLADDMRGAAEADAENLDENSEFLRANAKKEPLRDAIRETMVTEDLDVFLYPTVSRTQAEIGEDQDGSNCALSATSGFPALTMPAGFTDEGMPVGVELLGKEFDEPLLLQIAFAYEQLTSHREPPADFGPLPADSIDVPNPDYTVEVARESCEDYSYDT